MVKKEIKITCKGQKYLSINSLQNFQGNLKNLEDEQLEKLRRSILKYGFSFPVFVWENKIIDGHQRIFVTNKLLDDGYSIDKIPCVEIDAKNANEAAEKLLTLNSRFAKITKEGFDEFVDNFDIDLNEVLHDLEILDFDIDDFINDNDVDDSIVPARDPNVLVRLSFHPAVWMGKREEIKNIFEQMKKSYECKVVIED